jgi:23S rRNA pseudouridine2605 synthase
MGRYDTHLAPVTKSFAMGFPAFDLSPSFMTRSDPPSIPATPAPTGERLQKVLAAAGFGSRRGCEELIVAGRVTIDGQVVDSLGVRVDPESQKLAVDGERVKLQSKKYFLLNKPPGCLCTNSDPAGRPRVIDLLPPMETRLFTVGRLDENTEGLLLLTNDGELAHRLAHPRFQVERVYRVLVAGHPSPEVLNRLQEGLFFTEGKFRLRQAKKLKTKGQSTLVEVVITEGQNREVRRLFARIGHKVMSLQRIQFGPLRLGDMAPTEYRPLRPQELEKLRELAADAPKPTRKRRPPTATPRAAKRPPEDRGPMRPEGNRPSRPMGERPASRPGARPPRPTGKPATGKPATGKPASGKPASGKPASGQLASGRPTGKPSGGRPKPAGPRPGKRVPRRPGSPP